MHCLKNIILNANATWNWMEKNIMWVILRSSPLHVITESRGLIGGGLLLPKVILLNWSEIKHKSTFLEILQWHNETRQMLSPLLIFPYDCCKVNFKWQLSDMPLFLSLAMCKSWKTQRIYFVLIFIFIFFIILINLVLIDHF